MGQQHLAVVGPLGRFAIQGNVRAVAVGVAHVLEPSQGFAFELVFGHGALSFSSGAGFIHTMER